VGPRAGLDDVKKRKMLPLPGIKQVLNLGGGLRLGAQQSGFVGGGEATVPFFQIHAFTFQTPGSLRYGLHIIMYVNKEKDIIRRQISMKNLKVK
jgi:hypothetical protein